MKFTFYSEHEIEAADEEEAREKLEDSLSTGSMNSSWSWFLKEEGDK